MSEAIVRLDRSRLVHALSLSQRVGWNQTPGDWARLVFLEPEGCFGFECNGAIVATTTVICYGRALAWIGMVVTDPAYRGRGLARRLMERALEFIEERGVAWTKLDATEMGRPLYQRLGFEDECAIERWIRPASIVQLPSRALEPFRLDSRLDRRAFGADRGLLMETLANECGGASSPGGYVLVRSGTRTAHFGPCVAEDPRIARELLEWYLERQSGGDVSWDVLSTNREARFLARATGFEPMRRLVRMVRQTFPSAEPFSSDDSRVFATAGFEYG